MDNRIIVSDDELNYIIAGLTLLYLDYQKQKAEHHDNEELLKAYCNKKNKINALCNRILAQCARKCITELIGDDSRE